MIAHEYCAACAPVSCECEAWREALPDYSEGWGLCYHCGAWTEEHTMRVCGVCGDIVCPACRDLYGSCHDDGED